VSSRTVSAPSPSALMLMSSVISSYLGRSSFLHARTNAAASRSLRVTMRSSPVVSTGSG
jgi:hypothetical protein